MGHCEGAPWGCALALVAHGGFEPPISSLKGMRPGPLDECAKYPRIIRARGIFVKVERSASDVTGTASAYAGKQKAGRG